MGPTVYAEPVVPIVSEPESESESETETGRSRMRSRGRSRARGGVRIMGLTQHHDSIEHSSEIEARSCDR